MSISSKWLVASLLPLCLLAGCNDSARNASSAQVKDQALGTLEYPALPVIRNAVFSMSPLVDGKRNPAVMQHICGLARGELKQADVDRFVSASGETAETLKQKGGVTALLVNGNHQAQEIACAAFLATAPLIQAIGRREQEALGLQVLVEQHLVLADQIGLAGAAEAQDVIPFANGEHPFMEVRCADQLVQLRLAHARLDLRQVFKIRVAALRTVGLADGRESGFAAVALIIHLAERAAG